MPVIQSAKKALRQSEKRASRNRHFNELYKESLKNFERAIADGSSKTE
jgi:ribosomal protein S20